MGAWGLGARLALKDGIGSALIGLATIEFLAYSGAVIGGYQSFAIAVFQYLPATLFLTISVIVANRRSPTPGFHQALLGLLLTFAAAGIQQQQIGISNPSGKLRIGADAHVAHVVGVVVVEVVLAAECGADR